MNTKHLALLFCLFLITLTTTAQEKATETWVKQQVTKLVNDPSTNMQFKELYKTIGSVEFYVAEFGVAFEESVLVVCEPGDEKAFTFYEGMPVYLLLRIDLHDDGQWQVGWYKNWYEVTEVVDKTGDGISEAIGVSSKCNKGRCQFGNYILSLKRNNVTEMLNLQGWDYMGADNDGRMQTGDTMRYMRELMFIDLNEDGIDEIFVETELAVLQKDGTYNEFFTLVPYRLNSRGKYIPADETSYPKFIKQFFDDFETAVWAKNKPKIMTFFHPDYVKEQHDEMLEGRTDQFLKEYFCGSAMDGSRKFSCFGLEEIERMERVYIRQESKGYAAAYILYGNGKKITLTLGALPIEGKNNKYGLWGAVG